MDIGISNIAWDSQVEESAFSLLREHQIKYLEVAPTKILDISKYIKLCEKYGLNIFCLQSLFYGINLNIFDSPHEAIKHFKKNIDMAIILGAKNLVFGSPKNRKSKNINDINIFSYIMNHVDEYIQKSGEKINLNIEANPEVYDCNFLTDINQIFSFLQENKYKNVGIHFDTACHYFSLNKDIKEEFVFNSVHISEPFLNNFSLPTLNHEQYKKILIKQKYDGILSIEMKNTDLEQINKTLNYINKTYRG